MSLPTSSTMPVTEFARTKRSRLWVLSAAAACGAALLSPSVGAQEAGKAPPPAASSSFSGAQKSEIENIVKEYLLKNPEVFMEVQAALESKMEKIQAEKLKAALAANADTVFRDADAPVAGNPKGDVTVVEFFDYNCGYCKRGFPDLAKFMESDPNVRVVFRELPILSKGSEEAARVAIASNMQGKYWEFHKRMIVHPGQANESSALKIAEAAGLDMAQLKTDMKSPKVDEQIKKVRELAQNLNITGTPHFLVGNRSIPGAPQDLVEQLKSDTAAIRKDGGCTYC